MFTIIVIICTPAKLPCRRVEVGYEKFYKINYVNNVALLNCLVLNHYFLVKKNHLSASEYKMLRLES
jgi:hypothetical protein